MGNQKSEPPFTIIAHLINTYQLHLHKAQGGLTIRSTLNLIIILLFKAINYHQVKKYSI